MAFGLRFTVTFYSVTFILYYKQAFFSKNLYQTCPETYIWKAIAEIQVKEKKIMKLKENIQSKNCFVTCVFPILYIYYTSNCCLKQ